MQLSIMIIHWVLFNLLVKHYQILKDNCFDKTEISPSMGGNGPTKSPHPVALPCDRYSVQGFFVIESKAVIKLNSGTSDQFDITRV